MFRTRMLVLLAAMATAAMSLFVPSPAQAATVFDVGVIPFTRSCPAGSELVTIRMDDEDDSNNNSRGGFVGAINSTNNTEFVFCRVDGRQLRSFNGGVGSIKPYAVLKLGSFCPNGSFDFSRRFDNEDDDNANSFSGQIFPNISDSNTTLRFCLFSSGAATSFFPNLGFNYAVFSTFLQPNGVTGFVRTDDEDDSNNNQYTVDPALASIATAIVSSGPNTTLRLAVAR